MNNKEMESSTILVVSLLIDRHYNVITQVSDTGEVVPITSTTPYCPTIDEAAELALTDIAVKTGVSSEYLIPQDDIISGQMEAIIKETTDILIIPYLLVPDTAMLTCLELGKMTISAFVASLMSDDLRIPLGNLIGYFTAMQMGPFQSGGHSFVVGADMANKKIILTEFDGEYLPLAIWDGSAIISPEDVYKKIGLEGIGVRCDDKTMPGIVKYSVNIPLDVYKDADVVSFPMEDVELAMEKCHPILAMPLLEIFAAQYNKK